MPSPDFNRFSTVDQVGDPQQLIAFLDVAKALPDILAAKAEILERLEPGSASSALDVGCGYCADAVDLVRRLRPGGRAIGVDISENMVAEATRRAAGSGLNVELSEAVRASVVDGAVQAAIGRQVPRLFVAAGPVGVTAAPRVIPSDPGFFRLLLGHHVDELCRRDVIEPARVDAWWEAMDEAAAAGHFTGGGTAFVVSGIVS